MANYTAPDGTVYTSPEVARQYGVSVPNNISSGVDINTQTQQANQAISLSQLQSATPLNVPTATPTANPLEATAEGAKATSKSLDQYIAELTPKPSETSKQYDSLLGDINSLLPGLTGRGAEQVTAEQNAGLPDLKVKLSNLNAQILSKVAEATKSDASYEQLIANLENPNNPQQQGIPMAAIIGQQAQVRKVQLAEHNSKAADLLLLQAVASGMQGNITAMQGNIDRAIDLKYSDREAEVNLKMQQLQLLEGKLNKEEERTKLALERKYQDEQTKIAEEKAKAKENLSLAYEQGVSSRFAINGSEVFNTQTGEGFKDEADFKAKTGMELSDAIARGMVTTINYQRIAEKGTVQNWINNYPDANIAINDPLDVARQKVLASRTYQLEEQNKRRIASGSGSGSGSGTDPEVEAYATQLMNGSLKVNQLSGTAAFKAKVLARYEELKKGVGDKYTDEYEARVDYDQELRTLEQAKANGELTGNPSELIAALVNSYGKFVSKQEIESTVRSLFGAAQRPSITNKTTQTTTSKKTILDKFSDANTFLGKNVFKTIQ